MMSEIKIKDYSTGEMPGTQEQQWTTQELSRDFTVIGFGAPFVVVIRKSDNVRGTLQFNHSPRIYFGFEPS